MPMVPHQLQNIHIMQTLTKAHRKIQKHRYRRMEKSIIGRTHIQQSRPDRWALSGDISKSVKAQKKVTNITSRIESDQELKNFWEIERINQPKQLSTQKFGYEEQVRIQDGTYTERIPFKDDADNLEASKATATAKFQ